MPAGSQLTSRTSLLASAWGTLRSSVSLPVAEAEAWTDWQGDQLRKWQKHSLEQAYQYASGCSPDTMALRKPMRPALCRLCSAGYSPNWTTARFGKQIVSAIMYTCQLASSSDAQTLLLALQSPAWPCELLMQQLT